MFWWCLIMASHVWSRQLFTYKLTLYLKPCPRTDDVRKRIWTHEMWSRTELTLSIWNRASADERHSAKKWISGPFVSKVPMQYKFFTPPVLSGMVTTPNPNPSVNCARKSSSTNRCLLSWVSSWGCEQFSSLDQQSLYKTGPRLTLHIWMYILYPISKLYEACIASS